MRSKLTEETEISFDDFLKDVKIVIVDDARTFDVKKWRAEMQDKIFEEAQDKSANSTFLKCENGEN